MTISNRANKDSTIRTIPNSYNHVSLRFTETVLSLKHIQLTMPNIYLAVERDKKEKVGIGSHSYRRPDEPRGD